MPNDQVMIDRELLVELRDAASECLDREDRQRRQMIYSRLVSDSDAILAQPAPSDGVEVVAWLDDGDDCPDATASRKVMMDWANCGYSFKPLITLAAHQSEVARLRGEVIENPDTKGSRKALGAMNAKLKAKVGRLERDLELKNGLLREAQRLRNAVNVYSGRTVSAWDDAKMDDRIDSHLSQQAKP